MQHPGLMRFDESELKRIEDAQLMLLGVSFDDMSRMSLQQRYDLLEINQAQANPKEYIKR